MIVFKEDKALRKNNTKRRVIAAALVCSLGLGMGTIQNAGASTIQDAQDKINEANQQLDQTKDKISDIENKQSSLQKEIDALDTELVALLIDIQVLAEEIKQKDADIQQATEDLAEAEQTAADQYESMKKRIRFMYERGDNAMIEALLGAGSMADFLNRIEYFNQIYDYDRNMLNTYKATVQQVADLKETLELEHEEMVALQENQEHQSEELQKMLDEKRVTMSDFDTKLAQAEALAAQYKETIREQNEIIVAEQERIRREEEERRRREEEERRRQEEARRQEEERRRQEAAQQQQQQNNSGGGSSGSNTPPETGENPAYTTGVSGSDVVNFALQFVGNPYVWGGTSLTNGCDCSGFAQSVFKNFGITLHRTSTEQRLYDGKNVSYSNAQPGDLICYSGHVAIYIGNGRIVGAQSSRLGITTANATYRQILAVKRVL